MKTVQLGDLIRAAGSRAGLETTLPVYSVTKYSGFVPSLEYFKKQVFSRDLAGYKKVEPGDFAYATIHLDEGSIGIAPERGLISPMYTVFKLDQTRADAQYLLRYLRSPRALAQYSMLGRGAVHRRKAISLTALGSLVVPLPPLDEQRRIAAILDQADSIRTKRREALAHLDTLTASAAADLYDATHPRVALGDLLLDSPKNGLYLPRSQYGGGVPIVRIDSFKFGTGRLDLKGLRRLRAHESQVTEFGLEPGDILVNRVNSAEHVGKAALVRVLNEPTVFESNMMRLRLDTSRVLPEYAIEALLTIDVRRQIAPMVKRAVNQASINQTDVRAITIPLPPMESQRRFAEMAGLAVTERERLERAAATDDELFASLQSRAFRGEL